MCCRSALKLFRQQWPSQASLPLRVMNGTALEHGAHALDEDEEEEEVVEEEEAVAVEDEGDEDEDEDESSSSDEEGEAGAQTEPGGEDATVRGRRARSGLATTIV